MRFCYREVCLYYVFLINSIYTTFYTFNILNLNYKLLTYFYVKATISRD